MINHTHAFNHTFNHTLLNKVGAEIQLILGIQK
jgi:hypothetical protein